MKPETRARLKIGIVTLFSMALFGIMVAAIANLDLRPKREVCVNFSFINSLEVNAPVRFAGARVGEVKRVKVLTPEDRALFTRNAPYVQVFAHVDRSIQIPKGTRAMVNTMGFMGEKYLELMPESRSTSYLGENETLEGVDPTAMDTVFASAKQLSDEMQVAAKNMNAIVVQMQDRLPVLIAELEKTLGTAQSLGNDAKERLPKLILEMEKTLASAQDLAGDAKRLTGDVQQAFARNREDLEKLIQNARQITIYTKSLSHVLASRPWKLVWGFGGPLPIEPEDEKYQPPEEPEKSRTYQAPDKGRPADQP
ncbi:MAG: MCE family protein [Verrucomicrobiae bacterium]|nr:MCE family protein [Verrucomicrobiae bacterium]